MLLGLRASEWLPVVLTATLFALIAFGVDALATSTWADLVGLFYLLAAPFVYGWLKSVVPSELGWAHLPADLRRLFGNRID